MSSYVSNNSRNVANLLRQNQLQQPNRLRIRKGDKNYSKQMGNIITQIPDSEQKTTIRPESQEYPKMNMSQQPQNLFKISKKRRDTPQSYNDDIQLPDINANTNNILSQLQILERTLQTQIRRNRKITQQLQLTKLKLNQNTRYLQERQNMIQNKIQNKFSDLEHQVVRQKQVKQQFQQKIGSTQFNQKQIVNLIRNLQQQYSSQLMNMKAVFQQKKSQELTLLNKQKEKSTTLFMEVVRLGDNLQKASETIQNLNNNFQSRVQYLQNKLSNNQKNLMSLAQRNTSGNDILNEFGDKISSRLQSVESSILLLGKEQLRDKQIVSKLDASTNRISDDLNSLLRNMTNDFQSRLQGRVTEIVNRIVYQRQERMKGQQQIKKNLDMRERMLAERQMTQKEKLQNKYMTMDSQIRNQFIKKDESIRALQEALQQQYRALMRAVDKQSRARENTQNQVDKQFKRMQQNFRKQYDIYKLHQSDLVQKITEMIKIQINTRLSSDVDLKNLTSAIGNDLANDLNNLKQAFSNSTKKMNSALKQIKIESSERAAQLSHYMDEQIKKVAEVVSQKYNKMKNVFAKLSQLFRNHLASTQTNRKNFQARIVNTEKDFQILKNQVNSVIDQFYKDLQTRLKQEKETIETFTFKKHNQNAIRLNKLQQYVNEHFELIKQGLEGNKQIVNNRLNNFSNQTGKAVDSSGQNLKQLAETVHKIKQISQNLKQDTQNEVNQLKSIINQNNLATKQQIISTKKQLTNQSLQNLKKISQVQQTFTIANGKMTADLNTLRIQVEANRDVNNDNMKKINQDIDGAYKDISQIQDLLKKQNEKNEQQFARLKNDLTILQSEVRTSDKQIHEDMNKLIEITDMLKQKL